VDVASHVVIGASFRGGPCDAKAIVAAHLDAHGMRTPRALVGARFTWRMIDDDGRVHADQVVMPCAVAWLSSTAQAAAAAVAAATRARHSLAPEPGPVSVTALTRSVRSAIEPQARLASCRFTGVARSRLGEACALACSGSHS
jgi:hypothetical protein